MKKYLAYCLLVFLFVACGTDDPTTHTTKDVYQREGFENGVYVLTADDFQFFGDAHNEGLQYIYDQYIESLEALPTETNYLASICSLTSNFVNYEYEPTAQLSSITLTSVPEFNLDSLLQLYYTVEQRVLIARMESAFTFSTPQLALVELDLIDQSISLMSDNDSKLTLWSMNAVARMSILYWTSEEGQAWEDKFNDLLESKVSRKDYPELQGINWGSVAKADWAGFCAGLVSYGFSGKWAYDGAVGAIVGGLSTGGIGAVPGAIVGIVGGAAKYGTAHAVAASAGELAYQLIFD